MGKDRKYSIVDLDELIKSIKSGFKLNEEEIAVQLGYNEGYISQTRARGYVPDKFMEALKREFAKSNDDIAKNGSVRPQEAQHAPDSEYMRKYIDMLERENSRLLSQPETNLKMLAELKDIVLENFALLTSLRYAVALILLNQRKGLIRDLSRKEVSDLVVIADTLDKVVADAMALSPKMDKIRESIR